MTQDPGGVPTCYRHPDRETWIRCQRCDRPICPDCMRDAAVGYQCPSCVKEGARTTRSARTAYGGLVPGTPGLVSMVLVGINAIVWLCIQSTGGYASKLYQHLALVPDGICTRIADPSMWYPGFDSAATCRASGVGHWQPGVADGAPWQLITSAFTHVSFLHIAFNMYALWVLGPQVEHLLGRARFVALYLLAALAGSASVLWLDDSHQATVGASGAVFGLMAALLVIGRKAGVDMSWLWLWIGVNVVLSFQSHVSWQGHLGGFVGGGIAAAVLVYAPRERRGLVQGAGLAGLLVVIAAASAVRMGMLA